MKNVAHSQHRPEPSGRAGTIAPLRIRRAGALTSRIGEICELAFSNADDLQEVTNYLRAHRLEQDKLPESNDLPNSVRRLCEAHHVLLDGVRGTGHRPGSYGGPRTVSAVEWTLCSWSGIAAQPPRPTYAY